MRCRGRAGIALSPPGASLTEARAAWRQAVKDSHPDSMIARGVPAEAVKLAVRAQHIQRCVVANMQDLLWRKPKPSTSRSKNSPIRLCNAGVKSADTGCEKMPDTHPR